MYRRKGKKRKELRERSKTEKSKRSKFFFFTKRLFDEVTKLFSSSESQVSPKFYSCCFLMNLNYFPRIANSFVLPIKVKNVEWYVCYGLMFLADIKYQELKLQIVVLNTVFVGNDISRNWDNREMIMRSNFMRSKFNFFMRSNFGS